MHKEPVKEFVCGKCDMRFKTENNRINHSKTCGGQRANEENMRRCERCGREVTKSNIARHRRACTAAEGEGGVRGAVRPEAAAAGEPEDVARVYRQAWKVCPSCGQRKSATNMARHIRTCRGGRE